MAAQNIGCGPIFSNLTYITVHFRCISENHLRSISSASILPLIANGCRSKYPIETGNPQFTPTLCGYQRMNGNMGISPGAAYPPYYQGQEGRTFLLTKDQSVECR